ncbi:MAG: hypothetical protein CMB82_11895 [Flammeovirgaceae bacterium]|nr:hypothetical protein [Flammeovirgaceae bacterium]
MHQLVFSSLFIICLLLSGCSKEEENYENAISFLNNNPITAKAIYSEEFNELQVHSALQGQLLSDVEYKFSVNAVGDFQITIEFSNCNYEMEKCLTCSDFPEFYSTEVLGEEVQISLDEYNNPEIWSMLCVGLTFEDEEADSSFTVTSEYLDDSKTMYEEFGGTCLISSGTDKRTWLNIYGANYKANFKDIYSIKEDIFTKMDSTSYRLILNFAPVRVGSLCANGCRNQYTCAQPLPSFINIAPTTTVYTQQYLIFNDEETRALYKNYFEILRDGF